MTVNVAVDGDDEFETRADVIRKLGSIEVIVYKCTQEALHSAPPLKEPQITNFNLPKAFHRSDLGDEITLQTSLGPAEYNNWYPKAHEYVYSDVEQDGVTRPWATFKFYYRDERKDITILFDIST